MTDTLSLAIIVVAFLGGGFLKGVAGMGLPIITVAVLTFAFGLPSAMALMIVPGLIANAWQSIGAPHLKEALLRVAPFLIPSLFTIWFGTGLLVSLDETWLVVILGTVLLGYALSNIAGWKFDVPREREWWIAPIFGLVNGISTGMTGITSTPSVIYINGLGMKREVFVQALGLVFFISYIVLTASLWLRGLVTLEIGALSFFAVIPALAGMSIGKAIRLRTSEEHFKKIFFKVLVLLALYLILRSLLDY